MNYDNKDWKHWKKNLKILIMGCEDFLKNSKKCVPNLNNLKVGKILEWKNNTTRPTKLWIVWCSFNNVFVGCIS